MYIAFDFVVHIDDVILIYVGLSLKDFIGFWVWLRTFIFSNYFKQKSQRKLYTLYNFRTTHAR